MGCNIVEGEGTGLIIATGKQNQLSKIASSAGVDAAPTSLQVPLRVGISLARLLALQYISYWQSFCSLYAHTHTAALLRNGTFHCVLVVVQVEITRFVAIIATLAITTGAVVIIWWATFLNVQHKGYMTTGVCAKFCARLRV